MTKFEIFLMVFAPLLGAFCMVFGYMQCAKNFRECGYELKSHYIPSTNWVEVIKIEKNI